MMSFNKTSSYLIAFTTIVFALMLNACDSVQPELSDSVSIASPDNRIEMTLSWKGQGSPQYSLTYDGEPVLVDSVVDLKIVNGENKEHDLVILSTDSVDEAWSLPWGQFNQSRNHYNSLRFNLIEADSKNILSTLEVRLFDDALAMRHSFESTTVTSNSQLNEVFHYNLASDASVWSFNGEQQPKYKKSLIDAKQESLEIPLLIKGERLPTLAIQEASRLETAMIHLQTGQMDKQLSVVSKPLSTSNLPSSNAWRVLQIADSTKELLTSQTLVNLSPPSRIDDPSWIRTGKSLWDWRVRGAQYGSHIYQLDNESLLKMIDFAAANGMQYVMIDANWYGPEHLASSSPFTEIDGLSIRHLIKQANEKGIGFVLYLNDMASVNFDLDELFKTWSSWGAAGIKYGFMKVQGREKVLKTINIVELAAKHKLLINFHDDPVVPSGLRRTFPNWVTRESVHAQTDAGRTFSPSGFIQMAHVNALSGPLDMSNGFFKHKGLVESRNYVRQEVNSTIASELARALIIFSGLIILPDAPEEYLAKQDMFEFLQAMPASWDESKVISSDIHSHIITARRSGEQWFVGAATNEKGRQLELALDFLEAEQTYQVTQYADAVDAHYMANREAYEIQNIEVKKDDLLTLKLAPGGGQALWLRPVKSQNEEGAL